MVYLIRQNELTFEVTSNAICIDPPPMSIIPTVLLRIWGDNLVFSPGISTATSGCSEKHDSSGSACCL